MYKNIYYVDEIQIARELEEIGERVSGLILRRTSSQLLREREEEEEREEESEEEREEEQVINTDKSFKSDECVICLTNPPNVFLCNCGHLCLCEECDKVNSLEKCPVCKTENTIKRTIE